MLELSWEYIVFDFSHINVIYVSDIFPIDIIILASERNYAILRFFKQGGSMRKNFDFYSIRNDNNKRISDTRFCKISGAKQ